MNRQIHDMTGVEIRRGKSDSNIRSRPGPFRLIGRALARRCPNCGSGGAFETYLRQRSNCGSCGLRLDRGEPDFFVGAYTINLIAAELLVVIAGLVVILSVWPDVPWNALMYSLAGAMVAFPVITYPWSRQLWLAFDLIFQPAESKDFTPLKGAGGPRPASSHAAGRGPEA